MHGTHSWRANYYQTHSSERQRGVPSLLISFFFKEVSRKTRHQQPRIHLTNPKKQQSQDTQTATAAECARCCARLAAQQRLHRAHGDEAGSQGDAADDLLSAVHSSLSNVHPSWPAADQHRSSDPPTSQNPTSLCAPSARFQLTSHFCMTSRIQRGNSSVDRCQGLIPWCSEHWEPPLGGSPPLLSK